MSSVVLLAAVVAGVAGWFGGAGLRVLGRRFPDAVLGASTSGRAALSLAPPLLAAVAFVVLLVPDPFAGCHCSLHGGHHPHLCLRHPFLAAPLLAPALAVAVAWLAFGGYRVVSVLGDVARGERWATQLRRLPSVGVDGVEVRLVDDLGFGAFTVGVFRPVVVVDRAVWTGLEITERRALAHHEAAHVARRDPLTLAVTRLAAALMLRPSSDPWLGSWRAASERRCDRHAAHRIGDPAAVAEALVRVERLRSRHPGTAPVPALGIAAGCELSARVQALLDGDDANRGEPLANDVLVIGVVFVGVILVALVLPGGWFHHLVETALGFVV